MSFTFLSHSLRQILPRKEIRERDRRSGAYPVKSKTGDRTRTGRNKLYFDDERTVLFVSGVNITYPTTLQFDPGKVAGDLTASLETTIVGNVDPYAVDQFIPHRDQSERPGPFFDSGLFEQDETNTVNSTFMTGAAYFIAPDKFKSKISNKTILRAEFPLRHVSQMSTGSGIMYFNEASGCFVRKNPEYSYISNGQGLGMVTFAPLPFTPYGMAYMPLNDYALNGYLGSGFYYLPPAEQSVRRMSSYAADGSDSLFFDISGFNTGFATASLLNPAHVASNDQTVSFSNTLGHPFLIEKIVVEFPFQAGPDWLNDSFKIREAMTSDLQFAADAGGPLITFAVMRQDATDQKNRDLIASGTITNWLDMSTGYYTQCTGTYGGGGGFTDEVTTPDGVAQLGIIPNVIVSGSVLSGSSNFFTGTVKMVLEPQITSHVLRTRASGSAYWFLPSIISRTTAYGAVFGSIARRSSKYLDSGRSILGNNFALLDPRKLDQANNPVHVMDNQFEDLPQQTSAPPRITRSKLYMDVKSNTIKSPYLLQPEDKIVFCFSKHRAVADDSLDDPVFEAGGGDPSGLTSYHDVAIGTGSFKVTLYGDLIREDVEFHDTLNQRLETEEIWQDVGEDPVLDQFDVAYRHELSGCYVDRFNLQRTLPYALDSGVFTSSLQLTQLYSNFSSALQDVPISTVEAWAVGKRVFELAKSSRNQQLVSTNEIFWDTRLLNPAQAMKRANSSFSVVATDGAYSDRSVVIYSGPDQLLSSGISSSGQGVSEWFMGYPFESKFNGVTTTFELGKDLLPYNFGIKRLFSYNDIAFELGDTINRAIMVGNFGYNLTTDVLPLAKNEFIKYFYGIGSGYGKYDNEHVRGRRGGTAGSGLYSALSSANIRGWKYGMMNGFAQRSSQVFRRNHYGQPRDLLEQRLDAKFFDELGLSSDGTINGVYGVKTGPVQVLFYDNTGNQTDPLRTLSSNVSFEATSSVPYFDGLFRNRPAYDFSTLNIKNVIV